MAQERKYKTITYDWKQAVENKTALEWEYHQAGNVFQFVRSVNCAVAGNWAITPDSDVIDSLSEGR